MAKKEYDWQRGATLEEHSKRKLKILREYFHHYLITRCQLPQQEKFRLAVVDGFCGGGRYKCGTPGSPIVFLEVLQTAIAELNLNRAIQSLKPIEIECLLILNDDNTHAIEKLRSECAPQQLRIAQESPKLHIRVEILNQKFEDAYPAVKGLLTAGQFRNVLFNLDQCGHSQVENATLIDIMRSTPSAEIFYTFSIESLLAYLSKTNPELLTDQLGPFGVDANRLKNTDTLFSNSEWLGGAERLVFESFKGICRYVSPFSINNPDGWRYWLLHFAHSYRARQVYNNVLHDNASSQAHFGRSGLEMLSYDPSHEGALYLFDVSGRERAKTALLTDIPRLIRDLGDVSRVGDFYETIYNATPAHAEDIHSALIENPDIEVITPAGGERRKAGTIDIGDTIKLKAQVSFFPIFHKANEPSK